MPVGQAVTATRRLGPRAGGLRRRLQAASSCGGRSRGGVGGGLVGQRALDEFDDLGLRAGGAQGGGEVLLDQGAGELGQQLEVLLVRAFGGGDEEDQIRGAVLGAEINRLGQPCHGQRRFGDRRRAAVRDRDAAGDAGGGLGSRAKASAKRPSTSVARPVATTLPARCRITSSGELPRFWSSSTSSVVMS